MVAKDSSDGAGREAAEFQVLDFLDLLMRQRQVEAVAEGKQLLQIHFLGLVRDVL